MLKNSVLLMSIFTISLGLGVNAEAGKKAKVDHGPIDQYFKRQSPPKLIITPNKKKTKVTKAPANPALSDENLEYLLARMGCTKGLSRMKRGWLIKKGI